MSHPIDPVNETPVPPLQDSYTYHSDLDESLSKEEPWRMGIDEAGRGPVLGPMVYAAAYCPLSWKSDLEELGFDDSKALSPETRTALWEAFDENKPLCYSSRTISPQAISRDMLRRVPVNLNRQAEDATTGLIQDALTRGINIKECYVDALGPAPQWQARLSAMFPTITFTVCPKADSLFKIVGAASIIAKVTRDRYIENWIDAEDVHPAAVKGKRKRQAGEVEEEEKVPKGSGYPSDPKTQAFLKDSMDPVFGYKGLVRFSWATVKVLLDKQAVECRWNDDTSQPSAAGWFSADADHGKPKVWRDLGVSGVGEL